MQLWHNLIEAQKKVNNNKLELEKLQANNEETSSKLKELVALQNQQIIALTEYLNSIKEELRQKTHPQTLA